MKYEIKVTADKSKPSSEPPSKRFESQKLPKDIQVFLEGINVGLSTENANPFDKGPEWLDLEQFKKGQKFAQKYIYGVSFAHLLSLILIYAIPTSIGPFIFTGKSSTPFTAFRRYLLTLQMIHSWYDDDLWDSNTLGSRNIHIVRKLHIKVIKDMHSTPKGQLDHQVTLLGKANTPIWTTVKSKVKADFSQEFRVDTKKLVEQETKECVQINQLLMCIGQFGMMGLVIMYPGKFGAGEATKEELSAFVHTWRVLGYLLGIEDRFNCCAGNLEEVVQRCHHTMDYLIKPSLHTVTEDWEHMMRCMVAGASYIIPLMNFEVCLAYLYWLMDMPTSKQIALLSWTQTCVFYLFKFTVYFTVKLPGMLRFQSWVLRKVMDRAANFSPQHLQTLESLRYEYQNSDRGT